MKEYFKISTLYALVAAFPPALQLLVQPLIEGDGRLSAIDFSHMAIAETISSLVFVLVMFAFGNGLARFYYDHVDDDKRLKTLISSCMNSILFRGLIVLAIGFILKDHIGKLFSQKELNDFTTYGFASIFVGISRGINLTSTTLYRHEKKVTKFIIVSLLMGLFRVVCQLIGLFYYEMSFLGYVYGSAVGGGLISIVLLIHTYWVNGIRYDRELMKPVYRFTMPLFQTSVVAWALLFTDRYFLESEPIDLGIYDTALKFAMGIELILIGIAGAVQPDMFRIMKDGIEKNSEQIRKYSHSIMAQTQVLVAVAIIPTMFYLDFFYETELALASTIIAIVFIKFIFRTQIIVFLMPIYFQKKTQALFFISVFCLTINLLLNYLWVPIYGMYGAIYSTLISQFIFSILALWYQLKVAPVKWNMNKIMIFPSVIVGLTVILEFLRFKFEINSFFTSSVVVLLMLSSLLFLYKSELKQVIDKRILPK